MHLRTVILLHKVHMMCHCIRLSSILPLQIVPNAKAQILSAIVISSPLLMFGIREEPRTTSSAKIVHQHLQVVIGMSSPQLFQVVMAPVVFLELVEVCFSHILQQLNCLEAAMMIQMMFRIVPMMQ